MIDDHFIHDKCLFLLTHSQQLFLSPIEPLFFIESGGSFGMWSLGNMFLHVCVCVCVCVIIGHLCVSESHHRACVGVCVVCVCVCVSVCLCVYKGVLGVCVCSQVV